MRTFIGMAMVIGLFFFASNAQALTATEIVTKSWENFRQIETEVEEAEITVKYESGFEEKKALTRWMSFSENKDIVSIELTAPRRIKGTKLQISREVSSSTIDLRMKSWSKSRSVATKNQGKPFVGTDFTYKDTDQLSGENIADYDYKIKKDNQDYWWIEACPKDSFENPVYEKRVFKINQNTWAVEEIVYWKSGQVEKVQTNQEIQFDGEAWRPNLVIIKNNFLARTTFFKVVKREINPKIPSWIFTKKFFD